MTPGPSSAPRNSTRDAGRDLLIIHDPCTTLERRRFVLRGPKRGGEAQNAKAELTRLPNAEPAKQSRVRRAADMSKARVIGKAKKFEIISSIEAHGRQGHAVEHPLHVCDHKSAGRVSKLASDLGAVAKLVLAPELLLLLTGAGIPADFQGGLLHVAQTKGEELLRRRVTINELHAALRARDVAARMGKAARVGRKGKSVYSRFGGRGECTRTHTD